MMKKVKQLTSQVQRSKGWNRHVNPEEIKRIKSGTGTDYFLSITV